jgi:hypothetical protein
MAPRLTNERTQYENHQTPPAPGLHPSSFILFGAAPFDCGSTGAYGPINITNNTALNLPPDGMFHCTTITVASGATLQFNRNPLNTPVYLLATGDVVINGTVDISGSAPLADEGGKGGPGGFDGGRAEGLYLGQDQVGDGIGPGGGTATNGNGRFAGFLGNILLDPLIGGSGGRGLSGALRRGGTGGGGAILVGSNSRIVVAGSIQAHGGNTPMCYGEGHGSGGGIRLVAPVVGGNGVLGAEGGRGDICPGYAGRIRIDCQDNQAYRALSTTSLTSRGSRMIVFPTNAPQLDIVEVGGQSIMEGTNNAVTIELTVGASSNQTVRVQARHFTNDVAITVAIIPEHGSRGEFDATILQSSGNPPFATVPVIIPAGSACQVNAWTR